MNWLAALSAESLIVSMKRKSLCINSSPFEDHDSLPVDRDYDVRSGGGFFQRFSKLDWEAIDFATLKIFHTNHI